VAVVVVLLIVLVVAVAQRRRAARRDAARTAPDPVTASPTFRVVALGTAGSGKSVFLATMFHQLNVESPDKSYFLRTRLDDHIALSATYRQVAAPDEPWPRATGTGETRRYSFDCVAFDGSGLRPLSTIEYLDYAGELLEGGLRENAAALAELTDHIAGAHALLGMVDGHRVLQYLRREARGRAYFHGTLQPVVSLMAAATCPIHFVITKWDLVRGFGEAPGADDATRLQAVREALEDVLQLDALAARQGMLRRIVRLIPVSAVGDDFLQLGDGGDLVKRPDGRLRPRNVEAPLSAVLPDLFSQVESALDESVRQQIAARARSEARLRPAEVVAMAGRVLSTPAAVLLRGALVAGVGPAGGNELAALFVDWSRRTFDDKVEAVSQARSAAEQEAAVVRGLRNQMFEELEHTVLRLEATLPASRVGR
jgi:hypothetical protein